MTLFRISRIGYSSRWCVLVGEQPDGEYLDKGNAVIYAIEAATEARETGHIVEVWERLGSRLKAERSPLRPESDFEPWRCGGIGLT